RAGWGLDHVREVMGLADVLSAMWGECDDETGMHFCAARGVAIELVDPATGGQIPWEDGAAGEVVYTTFAREATPMLRYRSSDHVVVTGVGCSCGRTSPQIRCIGRTADRYPAVAARIETELRGRLQVRAAVSVVAPGSLPRSDYKTPLVHVRANGGREVGS